MTIAVVDDLLFSSKIRSVAQASGAAVSFVRGREASIAAAAASDVDLVIVDLEGRGGDAIETIRLIRSTRAGSPHQLRIVGFGSHVNVDLLNAAREAGCDQAMARSAFVAALPGLLTPSGAGAR